MQPNAAGLAERQEKVVRRFRRDIARIMAASLDFFDEYHPEELNRRAPLTGAETAEVVSTIQSIRADLQRAWKGFSEMLSLQPSRMTDRKIGIYNNIVSLGQILLGHSSQEAAERGIPEAGIMVNLRGDQIAAWVQGYIPTGDLARQIARRRHQKRPMPQSEIDAELKRLRDEGWSPDVNVWVGKWNRTIATCLHRILASCFEFTSEVNIRYLYLNEDQTRAIYGEFGEAQEEAALAAAQGEAQRMADDTGLYVQIVDKQGNIVGEKAPSQEIEKYVRQLAVRRGKASRGDWSRRKKMPVAETVAGVPPRGLSRKSKQWPAPPEDRPGPWATTREMQAGAAGWFGGEGEMQPNPDDEGLDRAMLALWTQVL